MKFDELYNTVFIAEADGKEVASPEDFNDVEPLPLPEPADKEAAPAAETGDGEQAALPAPSTEGNSTLMDYITKIEEFTDALNNPDGDSLAVLVSSLDQPETPFEGISDRTSAEIVDAAKTLRSIVEKLKNFLIQSSKK